MADEKKDLEGVGLEIEAPGVTPRPILMPNLPKPLTLDEKKFLLAVERGDIGNVRRMLQRAQRKRTIDVNCVDPLGRGALTLAIDGENLEMVEVLVVLGVQTKDALLHAINAEFVEAVELLLEHEELIHKDGNPYSWEGVDWNTGTFTPDITPLILAAHRNNYEILKILLDRGATLPMPHDTKCGCADCLRESQEDSLRHSMSRVNEYRALASPSLIALSSNDPILTAFQLSWELRSLAFTEQESKSAYMELRRQCQQFAVDLLDQSRSSQELAIILNHDPESPPYEDGEHMKLARLELAIEMKQKRFVAHPNIQQLLAAIWYEGVPGFRRKGMLSKCAEIGRVAVLFPFYCLLYMVAPNTSTGHLMRKPFMKFLIHASSYLFFLLILILVSQRAEVQMVEMFGSDDMKRSLVDDMARQRGNGPSFLECIVVVYVLGFIWEETMEIWSEGIRSYLRNMWNFIDFTRNSLYVAVGILRVAAYLQQLRQIRDDPDTAYIPRELWDDFDPQLIAEGLFAAANVCSALKLVHMFSINPHLGPLQISLGRMVIDIVKFFFIYSLVLFAFACGLNQLLWYFADLERRKCYVLPDGKPDWDNHADSCTKWRSFGNLFESSQSLFWASFGGVGTDSFELAGIKTYTRFWGLLMFGSYSVINVIVLLNLLIAMMSNSYAMITEHADTEWKFARTKLWMSYFEESATLPPPFNIFPTPKLLFKLLGMRKKDDVSRMSTRRKERKEKERDYRYTAVMRALVWRYVSAKHREAVDAPVTEDDISEVKGEVSAAKHEILEVLSKNGMDVSGADTKEKAILGKKMRVWERRLMRDFHVAPITAEEDMEQLMEPPPENEDSLARFRRIAKLAVLSSSAHKWGQVVHSACVASQIGRCNNRESFKNQQNLQKAMDQARRLVLRSPIPEGSRGPSPMPMPETTGQSLLELIKDFSETGGDNTGRSPYLGGHSGGGGTGLGSLLTAANAQASRSTTPAATMARKQDDKKQQSASQGHKQQGPRDDKQGKAQSGADEKKGKPSVSVSYQGDAKGKPTATIRQGDNQLVKPNSADQQAAGNLQSDPSPLISTRTLGGDSPPKVIKRKAPAPDATRIMPPPAQSHRVNMDMDGSAKPRPVPGHAEDKTAALPKFEVTLAKSDNSNNAASCDMMSSTEQLISADTPSPEPLRPGKRVEDVNTIKRQPKAGWI